MAGNTNISETPERPLSPHLQIYKWQITMALSILHRATGVAMTFGLLILAWWLLAAASGPEAYEFFRTCVSHPVGVFFAMGLSFCVFYHSCAGVRHLLMDTGLFFKIPEIYMTGYTTIICAVFLTAAFWLAIVF